MSKMSDKAIKVMNTEKPYKVVLAYLNVFFTNGNCRLFVSYVIKLALTPSLQPSN